MSSRIFQSIIVQMKEATNRVIGVADSTGTIVACSELSFIGSRINDFLSVPDDVGDRPFFHGTRTIKFLGGIGCSQEYAVFVDGVDDAAKSLALLAGIALSEANSRYEEKNDKAAFIKNIISDNILPGDIYVRAKELNFADDVPMAVFDIRQTDKIDVSVVEVLRSLFPDKQRDFIISISESDVALIKLLDSVCDQDYLYEVAKSVETTLMDRLSVKTVVGIGSIAMHLRELASRYKEAQVAIDVSKVFDSEKTIINYENLGIGRLIYQLPTTLCEMFLSEVFKKNPIDSLDYETLYTINKFFENNLNVSETSRKLFVHRNTLVYRLEKIKKLTGLDLREFDHAIVFKVALMVKKYLNAQDINVKKRV